MLNAGQTIRLLARFPSISEGYEQDIFSILSKFISKFQMEIKHVHELQWNFNGMVLRSIQRYLNTTPPKEETDNDIYFLQRTSHKIKALLAVKSPECLNNREVFFDYEYHIHVMICVFYSPFEEQLKYYHNCKFNSDAREVVQLIDSLNPAFNEAKREHFKPFIGKKLDTTQRTFQFILNALNEPDKLFNHIGKVIQSSRTDEETKSMFLWLAYEQENSTSPKYHTFIEKLDKKSLAFLFHKVLSTENPDSEIFSQLRERADLQHLESNKLAVMGFKLFKLKRFTDAIWLSGHSGDSYLQAMLAWRYEISAPGKAVNTTIIRQNLLRASGCGRFEAQCRLVDYILEQTQKEAGNNEEVMYRACFYINAPNILNTSERTLYQGITLYLGIGCEPDHKAGSDKIHTALNSQSPLPALRWFWLKHQGLIDLSVNMKDFRPLDCFAVNLVNQNYPRSTVDEILLSLGEGNLKIIIDCLTDRANSKDITTLNANACQDVAKKLRQWVEGIFAPEIPESAPIPHIPVYSLKETIKLAGKDNWSSPSVTRLINVISELSHDIQKKSHTQESLKIIYERLPIKTNEQKNLATMIFKKIMDKDYKKEYLKLKINDWYETVTNNDVNPVDDGANRIDFIPETISGKDFLFEFLVEHFSSDFPVNTQNALKVSCFIQLCLTKNTLFAEINSVIKILPNEYQISLINKIIPEHINLLSDYLLYYLQRIDSADVAYVRDIWKGISADSNRELIHQTFKILYENQSDNDDELNIHNDRLKSCNKLDLYRALSLTGKKRMIGGEIPEILITEKINEKEPSVRYDILTPHIIQIIRKLNTDIDKPSLNYCFEVMLVCRKAEEKISLALYQAFKMQMKTRVQKILDKPIAENWDWQETRIVAGAILRLLSQ